MAAVAEVFSVAQAVAGLSFLSYYFCVAVAVSVAVLHVAVAVAIVVVALTLAVDASMNSKKPLTIVRGFSFYIPSA